MKDPINGVSQDYNDNVNNPNTELCFHCRTYKSKTEFTNPESKFLCDTDYTEMQRLIKETNIAFKEVPGRKAHTLFRQGYELTDVYAVKNGEEYHLGAYDPAEGDFDLNLHKTELFSRKMQFLKTNGGYISFYNHSKKNDPLEFIKWIKEIGDNFGVNYDVSIKKYHNVWEFHGNLERISCAFHFRICSEDTLKAIIKALQDPYYKNISYTF